MKKILRQRCFLVKFVKFLRTLILKNITSAKCRIWIWETQGSDQVQWYKDYSNCPVHDPTTVGGEENFWFLDVPKRSILGLVLPKKTWERKILSSLKFQLLHIFQNFWIWARRSRHPMALSTMKICLNYPLHLRTTAFAHSLRITNLFDVNFERLIMDIRNNVPYISLWNIFCNLKRKSCCNGLFKYQYQYQIPIPNTSNNIKYQYQTISHNRNVNTET